MWTIYTNGLQRVKKKKIIHGILRITFGIHLTTGVKIPRLSWQMAFARKQVERVQLSWFFWVVQWWYHIQASFWNILLDWLRHSAQVAAVFFWRKHWDASVPPCLWSVSGFLFSWMKLLGKVIYSFGLMYLQDMENIHLYLFFQCPDLENSGKQVLEAVLERNKESI